MEAFDGLAPARDQPWDRWNLVPGCAWNAALCKILVLISKGF